MKTTTIETDVDGLPAFIIELGVAVKELIEWSGPNSFYGPEHANIIEQLSKREGFVSAEDIDEGLGHPFKYAREKGIERHLNYLEQRGVVFKEENKGYKLAAAGEMIARFMGLYDSPAIEKFLDTRSLKMM